MKKIPQAKPSCQPEAKIIRDSKKREGKIDPFSLFIIIFWAGGGGGHKIRPQKHMKNLLIFSLSYRTH